MGLIDSMPDEGPPADAGDTSSPNFGQGMSIPQMYEILMPLARRLAEQTGEDVQSILQEMVTDPTAIGRAKSMLGMDETTPFPNNIREPMPSDMLLNRVTDQELRQMRQKESSLYDNLGLPSTVPMNPVAKPTMSERLLSQMSLKD